MKTTLIVTGLLALSGLSRMQAQSSSLSNNSAGIPGNTGNTALGRDVLIMTTPGASPFLTATGYRAMSNTNVGQYSIANGAFSMYNNGTSPFQPGERNTGLGAYSLYSNLTGDELTAVGHSALYFNKATQNTATGREALYNNINALRNTATGFRALFNNNISNSTSSPGNNNTAAGHSALYSNDKGTSNTAIGKEAMYSNINGNENTAAGYRALYTNNSPLGTSGPVGNTAIGTEAMYLNQNGNNNVAVGYQTLYNNLYGYGSTAYGAGAMYGNTNGVENVAVGYHALYDDQLGYASTAIGAYALENNLVDANTAVGYGVLQNNVNGSLNTGIGTLALNIYNGYANTALGAYADNFAGSWNFSSEIGFGAVADADNKIRIGNSNVTIVETPVTISWPSDGRFKYDVNENDVKGLDFISRLRPVVYNFDTKKYSQFLFQDRNDSMSRAYLSGDFSKTTAVRQSGFIAQEVEQAAKDAGYNFDGVNVPMNEKHNYSVAYSKFVVPLTKAVQEQQVMIEAQAKINSDLQKEAEAGRAALAEILKQKGAVQPATAGFKLDASQDASLQTVVSYVLPDAGKADLVVYNLSGVQQLSLPLAGKNNSVLTLAPGQLVAGLYTCSVMSGTRLLGSTTLIIADSNH